MTNTPGDDPKPHEPGSHDDPSQTSRADSTPSGEEPGYWEQRARQEGPTAPYAQQPYPPAPPPSQPPGQVPGYYAPAPGQVQYAPDHPKATTSMVMGILGLVVCGFLAPFAWVMGKRTVDEIDASNGMVGGRGAAQAGYVLGIIGTVLLVIGLVVLVIYVIAMVAFFGVSAA